MHLEKLLNWVNEYGEIMHINDKEYAEKKLNEHLAECKKMIAVCAGDHENVAMFEEDKRSINQALELLK